MAKSEFNINVITFVGFTAYLSNGGFHIDI